MSPAHGWQPAQLLVHILNEGAPLEGLTLSDDASVVLAQEKQGVRDQITHALDDGCRVKGEYQRPR